MIIICLILQLLGPVLGAKMIPEKAINTTKAENGFIIETENSKYDAKHVILATGALFDLAEHIGVKTKEATEPG